MSHHIGTYTGRIIDLTDPKPEDIDPEDICWQLSIVTRWAGATRVPITVAEHSVLVARSFSDPHDKLAALTHDASEAYLNDLCRPLKMLLPEYQAIERRWMEAIGKRFGVTYGSAALKAADDAVLVAEMEQHAHPNMRFVLERNRFNFDAIKPASVRVHGWGRAEALLNYKNRLMDAIRQLAA